jgi:hypothetical protein
MIIIVLKKGKNRNRTRTALRDQLAKLGVSAQEMVQADLLVHGKGVAVPYDKYRIRSVVVFRK